MYHCPWTTIPLVRWMVQAFGWENQGNSWACQGCSLRSFSDMCGDSPLSDVVHVSYNTHKTLWYHVHNYIIVLGPLQHWWGTLLNLYHLRTRVTSEHVLVVVGGHAMVCGLIHPCQTYSMPHITFIKQLDSISRHGQNLWITTWLVRCTV